MLRHHFNSLNYYYYDSTHNSKSMNYDVGRKEFGIKHTCHACWRLYIYPLIYSTYSLTPNPNDAGDQRSLNHQIVIFGSLNAKNRMWTQMDLQIANQSHRAAIRCLSKCIEQSLIKNHSMLIYLAASLEQPALILRLYTHAVYFCMCDYHLCMYYYKSTNKNYIKAIVLEH